jgi:hypothetical protein
VSWTEWLLLLLVGERGIRIAWNLYTGGRAVYRASREPKVGATLPAVGGMQPGPHAFWQSRSVTTGHVPASVEVASDDVVSLDYSSGPKRH